MSSNTLLITGGCGYLGAHLLREIAADDRYAGARIRILDNLSGGSLNALLDLPEGPRYEFVEGDIFSPDAVRVALDGVDAVFHLAALVRRPFTFDQPTSTQQVNHWGTVRLLEQCQAAGVPRFLFASSASVYGPGGEFVETDACRPIGPYSCSKRNAERAVVLASESGITTTVLRMAMFYGGEPGLVRFDSVANRFVYLAAAGRSITVFGDGNQVRPFVHVKDAARALLWAHQKDDAGSDVYNVVEVNAGVGFLAKLFKRIRPNTRIRYTDQDYRERLSLNVSGDKLREVGWQPEERLEGGVDELMEHFSGLSPLDKGPHVTPDDVE